jgi:hypothetical protein
MSSAVDPRNPTLDGEARGELLLKHPLLTSSELILTKPVEEI